MNKDMLTELGTYWEEICYVGCEEKTIDELCDFTRTLNISPSTSRRHIDAIKNREITWFVYLDDKVRLKEQDIASLSEEIKSALGRKKESFAPTVTKENLNQVRATSKVKQNEIDELKKKLKDQEELLRENEMLRNQLEEERRARGSDSIGRPILILTSENVQPCDGPWEHQFVTKAKKLYTIPPCTEEKVLNQKNYQKRSIATIFTEKFLRKKTERLLEKQDKEEFVSDKVYVNNLLNLEGLTNQQKLALYATFSDYRHTEFEQLLNFAGDNNINADLMIEWSESLLGKMDFLQLKNSLRQFAKPSEFAIKYEFARELLLGKWYVEFKVNEKATKFVLVSEDDIKQVKELLKLPEDAFTYQIVDPPKEVDMSEVVVEKPDFVHSGLD